MTTSSDMHIPVLLSEVLAGLSLRPNDRVLDGTVGLGGHAFALLEAVAPDGELLAFDRDEANLQRAERRCEEFAGRTRFIHDSFGNIAKYSLGQFRGVLLDLGFSSVHVDDARRGFSFLRHGPLDMRYDRRQALTAETVVNEWSVENLALIFRRWGEEPRAAMIAETIGDVRRSMRIETTKQLADIILSVVPRTGKIHPATKAFQAIRIAVNDEMGELERGLAAIIPILEPGGRCAVITFHSLEDRMVKKFFQQCAQVRLLTKKPIIAQAQEIQENPRARSAKLRLVEKLV